MNPQQLSPAAFVRQLRDNSLQSGEPFRSGKIELLNRPPGLKNWKAKEIQAYHDTLLLLLAWPENNKILKLTQKAMLLLTTSIKESIRTNKILQQKLSGTGISGTELTGRFSFAITSWLINEFGTKVELHSSEANPETVKLFFQQLIPAIEYETISSGEFNLLQRIKKLKGKSKVSDIRWLVDLIETSAVPSPEKEFVFNELKVFITWQLEHPFTRGSINIPNKKIYYYKKNIRTPDFRKVLNSKLPSPLLLSSLQRQHLVNVAKASLVFLFRETEPFSFAAAESVKLFELERGFSIGLYGMKKEQRLSIESYIGYLVFKNGIPVAYGGGWIFGQRCQFGINILEPFRGAESTYIFSQLIRTYSKYYNAKRFVVKPYQFGKNNKEALQSGAFWFYYKHGFRPENVQLHKMADDEWGKKKANKHYRTSFECLKTLTGANLVLLLSKKAVPDFDASYISLAITRFINKTFNGNRSLAIEMCNRKTKKELGILNPRSRSNYDRKVLQNWSLLVQSIFDLSAWSRTEKKQLAGLIKLKGNNEELHFIRLSQKHSRFWKDLLISFKLSTKT